MIKLESVSIKFDNKTIIENLSCEFEDNHIYCIMGASGIGKTTLLNILSGLQKPDSGTVSGLSERKKSFIFQENRLIPWLSAVKNLEYVCSDESKAREVLKLTGLLDDKDKTPDELSGGMKRRLAIARAVAFGGDIFFIDEPLYGLDIKTSGEILELIKRITDGKTAFIVTHSPEEAFFLADRIIFIKDSPVSQIQIKSINEFNSSEEIKEFIL